MFRLETRKNSPYFVYVFKTQDGRRVRKSTGTSDRETASRIAMEAYEKATGTTVGLTDPGPLTLARIGSHHIASRAQSCKVEASMVWGPQQWWKRLLEFFGENRDPSTIGLADFIAYINHRRKTTKAQSYKREVSALKSGLELGAEIYGFELGVNFESKLFPKFKDDPEDEARSGKLWNPEDVDAYIAKLAEIDRNSRKPGHSAEECEFIRWTAVRITELKKLTFSMVRYVDIARYRVPAVLHMPAHICKGKRARNVGLVPEALAIIERMRLHATTQKTTLSRLTIFEKSDFKERREKASVLCGFLEPGHYHCSNLTNRDLRHTFASETLAAGVDLKALMEMMGHRTLEAANKYQSSNYLRTSMVALVAADAMLKNRELSAVTRIALASNLTQ